MQLELHDSKTFSWLTMLRIIQISLAVENHDQSLLETKPYFAKGNV